MSQEKNKEWVVLNKALLEISQISGFLVATKDSEEVNVVDIFDTLFSCHSNLGDLLLFSGNIFKVYTMTELNKIVNPDSYPQSVTLFSFMNDFYPKKDSEQWKEFGGWKKKTHIVRYKIKNARTKFSSHLDKSSVHGDICFDVWAEEIESLIKDTFNLFDFLYTNDSVLKESFDKEENPGLNQEPSKVANIRRNIMLRRVAFLRQCCLEKDEK